MERHGLPDVITDDDIAELLFLSNESWTDPEMPELVDPDPPGSPDLIPHDGIVELFDPFPCSRPTPTNMRRASLYRKQWQMSGGSNGIPRGLEMVYNDECSVVVTRPHLHALVSCVRVCVHVCVYAHTHTHKPPHTPHTTHITHTLLLLILLLMFLMLLLLLLL
jgi:hypothetical protein